MNERARFKVYVPLVSTTTTATATATTINYKYCWFLHSQNARRSHCLWRSAIVVGGWRGWEGMVEATRFYGLFYAFHSPRSFLTDDTEEIVSPEE
jgi:hypothetical protein